MKKSLGILLSVCFFTLFCLVLVSCSSPVSGEIASVSDNIYTCTLNKNGQEIKYELTLSSGKATLKERTDVSFVFYSGSYRILNENTCSLSFTETSDGSSVPSYLQNVEITLSSSTFSFNNSFSDSSSTSPSLPPKPDAPDEKENDPVTPQDKDDNDDDSSDTIIYPDEPTEPTEPEPSEPDEPDIPDEPEPTEPEELDPDIPDEPEPCKHENERVDGKVEPTCNEDGYDGDVYCVDCGELIRKGKVIPSLGHEYEKRKCVRCKKVNLDGTYYEKEKVEITGSPETEQKEIVSSRKITLSNNDYVLTEKTVIKTVVPARVTTDEELTFAFGENDFLFLPTENGFTESISDNKFVYERNTNGVFERFVFTSDGTSVKGASGYYETVTETEKTEENSGTIDEDNFTFSTENEVLLLSAETDDFSVIEKISYRTISYVFGEKITTEKVRTNTDYTIKENGANSWFTKTNEFIPGDTLLVLSDITLYSSAVDVYEYDENTDEYVFIDRSFNSVLPDQSKENEREFGGWSNENGVIITNSDLNSFVLTRIYGVYITYRKTAPTENSDGEKVKETLTITGTKEERETLPRLSVKNGYTFTVTENPTEDNDGKGSFENEKYGSYEITVPKLSEDNYVKTVISTATLTTSGKVKYYNETCGEYEISTPSKRKSSFDCNGIRYEIDLDKEKDNLIIDGEKLTAKITINEGEITFEIIEETASDTKGRKAEISENGSFTVYEETVIANSETLNTYNPTNNLFYGSYEKTECVFITNEYYMIFDRNSNDKIREYTDSIYENPVYDENSCVYYQGGLYISFVKGLGVVYSTDSSSLPKSEMPGDFGEYENKPAYKQGKNSLSVSTDGTYVLTENGTSLSGKVKIAPNGTLYLITSESALTQTKRTFTYKVLSEKETMQEND